MERAVTAEAVAVEAQVAVVDRQQVALVVLEAQVEAVVTVLYS
jgi:hypothetical protein